MSILVIDVALAAVLVAILVTTCRRTLFGASSRHRRTVGWLLIALPLPLAVATEVFASPPHAFADAAFVAGLAAFAVGVLLVLRSDDEDDRRGDAELEGPPWWPEFERDFRTYARRNSRSRVLR